MKATRSSLASQRFISQCKELSKDKMRRNTSKGGDAYAKCKVINFKVKDRMQRNHYNCIGEH